MLRLWQQILSSEKGQALPIVLALLVLGGLTIIPSLGYVTTSLNSNRIIEEGVRGVYAADAGVEDALWSLANAMSPSTQLSDNINQMEVAIQTEDRGSFTLYLGELVEPSEHVDHLDVVGNMTWDGGANAYKYTITVTWRAEPGEPNIKLDEVGARIPIGYSYQAGSAADFPENLSTDEPSEILDTLGAYLLNWEFESPLPRIDEDFPVQTQTFYFTGEGELEGDYAWVVASREDVGAVGEITGTFYRITATATHAGGSEVTAKIVADIMLEEAEETIIHITSWRVLN